MAAIKHYRQRPYPAAIQADQTAGLVGSTKAARVAWPRQDFAAAVFIDTRDQPVDRFAIGRKNSRPAVA